MVCHEGHIFNPDKVLPRCSTDSITSFWIFWSMRTPAATFRDLTNSQNSNFCTCPSWFLKLCFAWSSLFSRFGWFEIWSRIPKFYLSHMSKTSWSFSFSVPCVKRFSTVWKMAMLCFIHGSWFEYGEVSAYQKLLEAHRVAVLTSRRQGHAREHSLHKSKIKVCNATVLTGMYYIVSYKSWDLIPNASANSDFVKVMCKTCSEVYELNSNLSSLSFGWLNAWNAWLMIICYMLIWFLCIVYLLWNRPRGRSDPCKVNNVYILIYIFAGLTLQFFLAFVLCLCSLQKHIVLSFYLLDQFAMFQQAISKGTSELEPVSLVLQAKHL